MSKSTAVYLWLFLVFYSVIRLFWAMEDILVDHRVEIERLKRDVKRLTETPANDA